MAEAITRFFLCIIIGMAVSAITLLSLRKENNFLTYGFGITAAIAAWFLFDFIPQPFSLGMIVSWLIVGALVGSFAGMILTRSREGYGLFLNLSIGLLGAILGGSFFSFLGIDFGLGGIVVSASDLVSAFIGALVVVGGIKWVQASKASSV